MTDPEPKPGGTGGGAPRRPPLGRWLVDTMPRGTNFDPPRERKSDREIPFVEGEAE